MSRRYGGSSSRYNTPDDLNVSPSKEELRDHHLASSSKSPTDDGGGGWDMAEIQESATPEPPPTKVPTKVKRISSSVKAQQVASSAGTFRLNRIMAKPSAARIGYVPDDGVSEDVGLDANPQHEPLNHEDFNYAPRRKVAGDQVPTVADVDDEGLVGTFIAQHAIPPLKVDPRSIGGDVVERLNVPSTNLGKPSTSTTPSNNASSTTPSQSLHVLPEGMQQECLLSMRVKAFELTKHAPKIASSALQDVGGYAKHKRRLGMFASGSKARHKLRFVLLARSSNRPLVEKKNKEGDENDEDDELQHLYNESKDDDDDDQVAPTTTANTSTTLEEEAALHLPNPNKQETPEVSSFPVLVCCALHKDGTTPDVRKLVSLEQLTTVQDEAGSGNRVQLVFSGGDSVWLDFAPPEEEEELGAAPTTGNAGMQKEKFLWSLLQIHAMLCTSVVERTARSGTSVGNKATVTLQPLNVRHVDRAELQYAAQVNGFLRDSPTLCALLDRQRGIHELQDKSQEEKSQFDDGDMAYDILMGNYTTRVQLFTSVEEKADAEDVLNQIASNIMASETEEGQETERLAVLLQQKRRDLEAETCRRLIAWEDEKHYSLMGQSGLENIMSREATVDSLALSALFQTLDLLDKELGDMEEWLEERAAIIKPLTDDCRDIEEENRQLEQQWKSYDMLGGELRRLLKGVDIDRESEKVLKNPASVLVYDANREIDVVASEVGVDRIHAAGMALKSAMDSAKQAGGVHLMAVGERVQGLSTMSETFCTGLAQIIVTVMEQLKTEVVAASDHGKVSKSDTHVIISRKVRDTQRKFQSGLLGYMKLIEILATLRPNLLPAIRDAYSEMVAEGILMKKRMKGYFQALPGKNSAYMTMSTKDLNDYSPYGDVSEELTVNAADIGAALGELLPVVAREAYFTAALFGLSNNRTLDGREKKRNFESAKRSVDHSTQYFRYYVQRTCGIIEGEDLANSGGGRVRGDAMLALVASIYLNEAMEQYVDREKKGGDQSLSLAYVRATILGLRKKVDKQWVAWVEEQIDWIRSNPGVPLNGKRAGVFVSFSRFPTYLKHILVCTREGKPEGYTPDFAKIQVVNYYLQKMANGLLESLRVCSERETTDQQYGSNVMRMENTYFFTQQIKELGPEMSELFQKQLTRAGAICKESTDAYLGWMIKREFKALHTLFTQISRVRRDVGDKDVSIHVPRSQFVKTLQKESNREAMREKITLMYDRMEKHLSEDGGLLPIAWKALVKVIYEWFGRWEKLSMQCYKHVLEPSAVDIVRLAKQVGTTTPEKPTGGGLRALSGVKQKPTTDSGQFTGRRLFGGKRDSHKEEY